ncbi:MAG: sugar ABC transporter permease [Chloroflexi bacterium]|nr:sugar ABC transporter permease [Chloroflexota bacterium]
MVATKRKRRSRQYWINTLQGYIFIGPVVLGLLIWTFGPMVASLIISFTDYPLLKAPTWVGLQNYIDIFTRNDELRVVQSLQVTATYAVMALPLGIVLALLAALLLNQKLRGMSIFRTSFYLPTIVPAVASAFMWSWLLQPDFGIINSLLKELGMTNLPRWMAEPESALPTLVLISAWGIGGSMVIFLAGLQSIPEMLYEAAKIDGANDWQMFWRITLPQLSPTIFFILVTGMIGALQYFSTAFLLSGGTGGPLFATYFYNLNLYDKAFKWLFMGLASAMAWVLFLIIFVLTMITFRSSDAWVFYEVQR